MNIFRTHDDPVLCAQSLDNTRVGKLLMEAGQLASTAVHVTLGEKALDDIGPGKLTMPTHIHHPLTKWVAASRLSFSFTLSYGFCLAEEYRYRFGKEHKAAERIHFLAEHYERVMNYRLQADSIPQPNCARHGALGLDFSDRPLFQAYRDYLNARWRMSPHKPNWGPRGTPNFYQGKLNV